MRKNVIRREWRVRGVVADVKTVVALLVLVGLGFSVLYMILGAAAYTLDIYGQAINDTTLRQGKEALMRVSEQAMSAVAVLIAIPLIIAAILIIKYIAGAFGFDFGFGRWVNRKPTIPVVAP
ncbi:MAG: hypothetical protein QXS16_03650 [Pyrobaculum sp.]